MFHSHLDSGGLGEVPAADAPMVAPTGDVSVTSTNPSVPAPVAPSNTFMSKLLLVGGIALVVFFVLQAINKSKKADA